MTDSYYTNLKNDIKADLPMIITGNGLDKPGKFTTAHGGEFACPACGKTLKLYRNGKGNWAINTLAHCACFGPGGYSGDSFGLTAAITGEDEQDVFRRLMTERGYVFKSENSNVEKKVDTEALEKRRAELEKRAVARSQAVEAETIRRDSIKAFNGDLLMSATHWGFAMSDSDMDLLYKRGIDPLMLPAGVLDRIGHVKADGFKCLDKDGTYSVEGVVFKVGDNAGQVRRTVGDSYVGKESKMARFQTFGPAESFLLDLFRYETHRRFGEVLNTADDTPEKLPVLFICEGPFDALSALEAGAEYAIAALGAGNHHYILEALALWRGNVMVCFDTDSAGKSCGAGLVDSLRRQGNDAYLLKLSGTEHDVNDLLNADRESLEKRIELVTLTAKVDNISMQAVCDMISSADYKALSGDNNADKHVDRRLESLRLSRRLQLDMLNREVV